MPQNSKKDINSIFFSNLKIYVLPTNFYKISFYFSKAEKKKSISWVVNNKLVDVVVRSSLCLKVATKTCTSYVNITLVLGNTILLSRN